MWQFLVKTKGDSFKKSTGGKLNPNVTFSLGLTMSLQKYMPDLAALFSHVVVDVSSVKALCIRWYPKGEILTLPHDY